MANFFKKLGRQMEEMVGEVGRKFGKKGAGGLASLMKGTMLLHGQLQVEVKEARGLPDTDNIFFNIGKLIDKKDVTDPFVTAWLGTNRILMTSVKDNTMEPVWNQKFIIPVCHLIHNLVLEVRDKDHAWTEAIGKVEILAADLISIGKTEGEMSGWFDILDKNGNPQGQLCCVVRFTPTSTLKKQYNVDSYFPIRTGCHVELFSCARNSSSAVKISDGSWYRPGSCYISIYQTLLGAERFIYITGWSVWTKLMLVRGEDVEDLKTEAEKNCAHMSLGELLKIKADQGVRVLLMIWSEATSGNMKEQGMMGTHDMETYNYFKDSGVECCLTERGVKVGELTDVVNNQLASSSYTHHQKTILADSGPRQEDALFLTEGDDRRTIVAYVGGLDLTNGRYDTPEHPLFKTLGDVHRADFYQNSAPDVKAEYGPRQPWQDIHTKLTGKVALDVLQNFTERWRKQAEGKEDMLYEINTSMFNLEDETGDWNVQLLRSITDDSAAFSTTSQIHTLTVKKSRKIEESIAQAYITAIRAAEKFIYLENQYFLGSAFSWSSDNKINCHHTVPAEIAEKIVEKIKAREDFTAFIVIPLHPEGDPNTAPLQEILSWQRRTMTMMYRRVAEALRSSGSCCDPTDYLMFLCLVTRESESDIPEYLATPSETSRAGRLRRSRRFMIYVHSKLMIVDDSLAIVGSANINQRSLAGSRDTEIAVICHQPDHCLESGVLPKGEVAHFRMRLMEEHLGVSNPLLMHPHAALCTQFVREMCTQNWQKYMEPGGDGGGGHMVLYPIDVAKDGKITPKDDIVNFPDTEAKIEGSTHACIPEKLTT